MESHLQERGDLTVVHLDMHGQRFGIPVAEILGVQKLVIKPMADVCRAGGIFEGAALLGDGRVAMVLGEAGLSALAVPDDPTGPAALDLPSPVTG